MWAGAVLIKRNIPLNCGGSEEPWTFPSITRQWWKTLCVQTYLSEQRDKMRPLLLSPYLSHCIFYRPHKFLRTFKLVSVSELRNKKLSQFSVWLREFFFKDPQLELNVCQHLLNSRTKSHLKWKKKKENDQICYFDIMQRHTFNLYKYK